MTVEVELKCIVADLDGTRSRLERAGATLRFVGRLEDRRYDRSDHSLAAADHVLRLRIYWNPNGSLVRASLDWKGPTTYGDGYKRREELTGAIEDPEVVSGILERLGFVVTMAIDRDIWQYESRGATVRFERYPRMDDLVEVEGMPDAIERAIQALGLPRSAFAPARLSEFVRQFEERTGERAALSNDELAGVVRYDVNNA